MADNIDKKEPVAICDQSKIDITKCDNHELAGKIEPLIKVIRGQQVMFDKDLATLYGVETKVLNQTVKRNIERFPNDFLFELSREECLRSQIVTSNGRGGNRYSSYAFTEQGVAMLSSVLRSKTGFDRGHKKYWQQQYEVQRMLQEGRVHTWNVIKGWFKSLFGK